MSFILDALKKSESERQQQSNSEFASVPSSSGNPNSLKWLWLLGALLLVNVAVLLGLLLRDDAPAEDAAIATSSSQNEATVAEPSFEEQVAAAKLNQPQSAAVTQAEPIKPAASAAPKSTPSSSAARILTIDEVRLNGTLQLTDLHLDIHVYSDIPEERFVFINMAKLREQSQLEEGPTVVEITRDGVILEHQGTTFLMPRE
jgi:general secretion pathway protein B